VDVVEALVTEGRGDVLPDFTLPDHTDTVRTRGADRRVVQWSKCRSRGFSAGERRLDTHPLIRPREAAMSTTQDQGSDAGVTGSGGRPDMKLEVVVIAVADVDRAKQFYGSLGWRLDADFPFDNGFRVVQFTPPGSGCSVQFGTKMTSAAPGSAQGLYLIVSDIGAARDDLLAHGVDASEVFHAGSPGAQFQPDGANERLGGPAPDHATYSSFLTFSDPDGNGWLLQEVTTRLPGRIDVAETSFASTADLASALRRAAAAHGEHEKRTGEADANWPDWYADYMVREQAGSELPS
jgi:catechol 2,3-dioxygenase-like lactoylglutathione lyase family enzyme